VSIDRVLLVGLMGAGKTSVGTALAARLGWPWLDNDDLVAQAQGASKQTLAALVGVSALHAGEVAALQVALTRRPPLVAGVAGFAPTVPAAAGLMAAASGTLVVWLRADVDTLAARLRADPQDRPLLGADPAVALRRLAVDREPAYSAVADLVLDVAGHTPEELAARIATRVVG